MVNVRHFILLACLSPQSVFAENLIDPTRPDGYFAPISQSQIQQQDDTAAVNEWILNTTLVSPYQKIAMINGKRLQEGDEINGAEVINIDHQKVDLRRDGKIFTIKLSNSFISKINPVAN